MSAPQRQWQTAKALKCLLLASVLINLYIAIICLKWKYGDVVAELRYLKMTFFGSFLTIFFVIMKLNKHKNRLL